MNILGDYATLRQYNVFPDNPNQADVETEVILIAQNRELSGYSAHSGGEVTGVVWYGQDNPCTGCLPKYAHPA